MSFLPKSGKNQELFLNLINQIRRAKKKRARAYRPRHILVITHNITKPIFVLGAVAVVVLVFWLGRWSTGWRPGGGGAVRVQVSSVSIGDPPAIKQPELPAMSRSEPVPEVPKPPKAKSMAERSAELLERIRSRK